LKRFVHISTNDVYGYPAGGMGDETVPMHDNGIAYISTKIQGEKLVHKYIQDHQLPGIILRPSNIFGPRGGSFVPVGLVLGKDKYWLGSANYPGGLVYVDHVALACILAAFTGDQNIGQVYNVSDEPKTTWQDYFDEIAKVIGIPPRPRRYWRVPFTISYILGWFFESVRLFSYSHCPDSSRSGSPYCLDLSRFWMV
jgi:nucleoside-diphosphate-sugar epimerase